MSQSTRILFKLLLLFKSLLMTLYIFLLKISSKLGTLNFAQFPLALLMRGVLKTKRTVLLYATLRVVMVFGEKLTHRLLQYKLVQKLLKRRLFTSLVIIVQEWDFRMTLLARTLVPQLQIMCPRYLQDSTNCKVMLFRNTFGMWHNLKAFDLKYMHTDFLTLKTRLQSILYFSQTLNNTCRLMLPLGRNHLHKADDLHNC